MNNAKPHRKMLLVEDDRDIAELVAMHARDLGLDVEVVHDGTTALERVRYAGYEIIILDVMLPGVDGFEVCKAIRTNDRHVPIMMLTAKSEEIDKVLGLEFGADDYVTKPFGIRELTARIKALLRRSGEATDDDDLSPRSVGGLTVDPRSRSASVDGRTVELTAKEFDLLWLFVRNPGRAFSRSELLDKVWGYNFEGYDHTVNSHINRVRQKIEPDPANPTYLLTVWGVGYRCVDPGGGFS